MIDLKPHIRGIRNFPKKGVIYRDITTLLKDPEAFTQAGEQLYQLARGKDITKVCGIEARGFIYGAIIADKLGVGFVPIRKDGKLPAETEKEVYELEYGNDALEIHTDAITKDDVVLIYDDLLATGGTARATVLLVEKCGARIAQISFLIELTFLKGRDKLYGYDVHSLVTFDDEN
jgi:adenine phosphoribosyltransferase